MLLPNRCIEPTVDGHRVLAGNVRVLADRAADDHPRSTKKETQTVLADRLGLCAP
jgi:hypothetical protein